ncbi:hypothetical protein F66182_3996 [Fusarium sp. NRRL 66182]|nr:hypothetical protein F66182_3996 [Fusarium sp. NRRL 66182]
MQPEKKTKARVHPDSSPQQHHTEETTTPPESMEWTYYIATILAMSVHQYSVRLQFGLRPSALRTNPRQCMPIEQIEEAEQSPTEANTSFDATEVVQSTPRSISTPENQGDDRSSTISPPPVQRDLLPTNTHKNLPPNTESKNSKKRRRSDESQSSNDGNPTLPAHFPPCPIDRPSREDIVFWRDACRAVQHPDGTVEGLDVVNRLLTRKGGLANPWPRLSEGLRAIDTMRRETIDVSEIRRRQEEEEEILRAKEERRLANKRRYRPRGQIDRERAERRAALAAEQAQEKIQQTGNTATEEHGNGIISAKEDSNVSFQEVEDISTQKTDSAPPEKEVNTSVQGSDNVSVKDSVNTFVGKDGSVSTQEADCVSIQQNGSIPVKDNDNASAKEVDGPPAQADDNEEPPAKKAKKNADL